MNSRGQGRPRPEVYRVGY